MGYYTNFTFKHSRLDGTVNDDLPDEVVGFLHQDKSEHASDIKWAIDGEEVKWYDHDDDMKWLSEQFPTILFILEGAGEEAGDVWRKLFLNGKTILHQTIGELPPIPENLLEESWKQKS